MAHPFYTIGHGTRPLGEFAALLQSAAVTLLADVRTVVKASSELKTFEPSNPDAWAEAAARFERLL